MPKVVTKDAKILIVDDSQLVSMIIKDMLEWAGYAVVGLVHSAQQLMQTIREAKPDLIVLDQHLPDGKGLELISQIRTSFPAIKLIMVTLECDQQIEKSALRAGACAFVSKPVSSESLLGALDKASIK